MAWQQRLLDLVCAGGAIAMVGCTKPIPCGNADPDPCICGHENDNTPQCNAERACRADGGTWNFDETGSDGVEGACTGSGSAAPSDAALHD